MAGANTTRTTCNSWRVLVPLVAFVICGHAHSQESGKVATATSTPAAITQSVVGWEISDTHIASPGRQFKTSEGGHIEGHTIEGTARPIASPSTSGKFRLVLSLFSPAKDMPGQVARRWYARGEWTITDFKLSAPTDTNTMPENVVGSLIAETGFNPTVDAGRVTGTVFLKRIFVRNRRLPGRGNFSSNEKFEGTISILLRMPATAAAAPINTPDTLPLRR